MLSASNITTAVCRNATSVTFRSFVLRKIDFIGSFQSLQTYSFALVARCWHTGVMQRKLLSLLTIPYTPFLSLISQNLPFVRTPMSAFTWHSQRCGEPLNLWWRSWTSTSSWTLQAWSLSCQSSTVLFHPCRRCSDNLLTFWSYDAIAALFAVISMTFRSWFRVVHDGWVRHAPDAS